MKDRAKGIRIIGSGISVYEVEVDLGEYAALTTDRLGGFRRKLLRLLPTLAKHECYAGEAGGFVEELDKGTDLAHVMEHVILELLKLASGPRARFSGWTRKRSKHYVIHFQAPSAHAAMRAAAGAIEVIEGIISGKGVDSQALVSEIRNSKDGFRASHRAVRNPKGVSKCK